MKRSILLALAFVGLTFGARTAGAQANVLVEVFRNFNCLNCRQPDDEYEAFLKSHPEVRPALIYYHNQIPSSTDKFYTENRSYVDARSTTYYSVNNNPIAFIDGVNGGITSESWISKTNQAIGLSLPVTITATSTIDGQSGTLNVHLSGATAKQVKLFVAILESGIVYDNKELYGNPTSGTWDNIFRRMAPSPTGSEAFTFSGSKDMEVSFIVSNLWNAANIKAIAWVQEVTAVQGTHLVEGLAEIPLASSSVGRGPVASGFSLGANQPNPFSQSTILPVNVATGARVKVALYDLLGKEVSVLMDEYRPAGLTNVGVDAKTSQGQLTPGIYIVRMFVDGGEQDRTKILYQR